MKSVLLILTLSLAGSGAFARGLFCNDVNAGSDNGYFVQFSQNEKTARLATQTMAGPREIAKLTCGNWISQGEIHELNCVQPGLVDDGFRLVVRSGGFVAETHAQLFQISLKGSDLVTDLDCK